MGQPVVEQFQLVGEGNSSEQAEGEKTGTRHQPQPTVYLAESNIQRQEEGDKLRQPKTAGTV